MIKKLVYIQQEQEAGTITRNPFLSNSLTMYIQNKQWIIYGRFSAFHHIEYSAGTRARASSKGS